MCESKGLDVLHRLHEEYCSKDQDINFTIDFYGQLTDDYFMTQLKGIPEFNYKGVLQPEEVINVLRTYDALIFPSHYEGEGCPGILVEALFAGLPIIASDWKYNGEFVENGVNGFLCNPFETKEYFEAINNLAKGSALRTAMKSEALRLSKKYTSANAEKILGNLF